jgi:hypothetical protein
MYTKETDYDLVASSALSLAANCAMEEFGQETTFIADYLARTLACACMPYAPYTLSLHILATFAVAPALCDAKVTHAFFDVQGEAAHL